MAHGISSVILYGGAFDASRLHDGTLQIRFFATRQQAVAAGLSAHQAKAIFQGQHLDADDPPCIRHIRSKKSSPNDEEVFCEKKACTKTECNVYSMPKNGDPNKDWKKQTNPCDYDSDHFYKCECE